MNRILFTIGLFACSHNGPPEPPPAPTCEVAAARMVGLMADGPEDSKAAIRRVVADRCKADAWSGEARSCIASVNVADDLTRCEEKLTDDQKAAMGHAGDSLAGSGQ